MLFSKTFSVFFSTYWKHFHPPPPTIMNRLLLLATTFILLPHSSLAMEKPADAPTTTTDHLTRNPGHHSLRKHAHPPKPHAVGSPPIDTTKIFPLDRTTTLKYPDTVPAAHHKLIGVGDWHGDVAAAVETLVKNGVLSPNCDDSNWFSLVKYNVHPFFDEEDPTFAHVLPDSYFEDAYIPGAAGTCTWIAKDTIVVSTGDFLDRGPDTLKMLWFVGSLEKAAELATLSEEKANTAYVQLLGNHELMNIAGSFRKDSRFFNPNTSHQRFF